MVVWLEVVKCRRLSSRNVVVASYEAAYEEWSAISGWIFALFIRFFNVYHQMELSFGFTSMHKPLYKCVENYILIFVYCANIRKLGARSLYV